MIIIIVIIIKIDYNSKKLFKLRKLFKLKCENLAKS